MGEEKAHVIRFPKDTYAKLRKLADMERRSINAAVVVAVEQAIADYERRHGVITPDKIDE